MNCIVTEVNGNQLPDWLMFHNAIRIFLEGSPLSWGNIGQSTGETTTIHPPWQELTWWVIVIALAHWPVSRLGQISTYSKETVVWFHFVSLCISLPKTTWNWPIGFHWPSRLLIWTQVSMAVARNNHQTRLTVSSVRKSSLGLCDRATKSKYKRNIFILSAGESFTGRLKPPLWILKRVQWFKKSWSSDFGSGSPGMRLNLTGQTIEGSDKSQTLTKRWHKSADKISSPMVLFKQELKSWYHLTCSAVLS